MLCYVNYLLLDEFTLTDVSVPLTENVLAALATIASVSGTEDAILGKMREKGVARAEIGITLVISNK